MKKILDWCYDHPQHTIIFMWLLGFIIMVVLAGMLYSIFWWVFA